MRQSSIRFLFFLWLIGIAGMALVYGWHLSADFPNHSPWMSDWAKYTDEGWYGNAAIRAHLYGNWYMRGDFNPAPAVPVWPLMEWALFCVTGVSMEATRSLAVAFFFVNLLLSYFLLKGRGSQWVPFAALTLLVTSPFLYSFSRLAILEPMLIAFTLAALNVAVRLPKMKRPFLGSIGVGVLFTLMMLTKTTAVFLLPALVAAVVLAFRQVEGKGIEQRKVLLCALVTASAFVVTFGSWMGEVIFHGLLGDYRYLFYINKYPKPSLFYWPLQSLWWAVKGSLWVDHILVPLVGVIVLVAVCCWKNAQFRKLLLDPLMGASILSVAGYVLFMTYQNHPQPRYYAVVAFFCIFIIARGTGFLLEEAKVVWARPCGLVAATLMFSAVALNEYRTLHYVTHPEYTLARAADQLTQYIDAHPNGNRLLVSSSGDEITLLAHLPSLCDDFGMLSLPDKIAFYHPGWYAAWNDLDPGTLADLHTHYSLEQVASFPAMDDPERNVLVLFKLHPLPGGLVRDQVDEPLNVPLDGDKIDVDIE